MNRMFALLTSVFLLSPQIVHSSDPMDDPMVRKLKQLSDVMTYQVNKSRDRVRAEFLRKDFDFKDFLAANQAYMDMTGWSLLQASYHAFGEYDLCQTQSARVLWLMKKLKVHVKKELGSELTPFDYYCLGASYMKETTRLARELSGQQNADLSVLDENNDKNYKYFERVVKAKDTIPDEGLLDCYLYLSANTFKKGLYHDHILYAQEFLRLNKIFQIFVTKTEVNGKKVDIEQKLFSIQHELAMSFALCGQNDKAIEAYKALLADDHLYSDEVKKMSHDELFILFSVYQSVQDIPTSRVLEALIHKTLPRLGAHVMRAIRTSVNKDEKKPQTSSKSKAKTGKAKKTNKEEMSDYMRTRFITERIEGLKELCKVCISQCQSSNELAKKHGLESETLNSFMSLERKFKEIMDLVSQLKGTFSKDVVRPLLDLQQQLRGHQSALTDIKGDLKSIISDQLRARKQVPVRAAACDMELKPANTKAEVLAAHAQVNVKEKTHGEARPSAVAPKSAPIQNEEEAEAEDNKFGNIISCSDEVALILDTQLAWDLPASSVECLNILKNAKNIKDLQETLKVRKAKLKILRGKNEGVWQFRVNDKIRIRFNLVEGRFTNVQIGDFH